MLSTCFLVFMIQIICWEIVVGDLNWVAVNLSNFLGFDYCTLFNKPMELNHKPIPSFPTASTLPELRRTDSNNLTPQSTHTQPRCSQQAKETTSLEDQPSRLYDSVMSWLKEKGVVRGDPSQLVLSHYNFTLKKVMDLRQQRGGQGSGLMAKRLKRNLTINL